MEQVDLVPGAVGRSKFSGQVVPTLPRVEFHSLEEALGLLITQAFEDGGYATWRAKRAYSAQERSQLWLCRISVRPPQTALFGRASTVPVTELRRKRMLEAPERLRALTIWPSGIVTRVPAVT